MAINWFPGHMHKARKEIKKVMPQMDLIIDGRILRNSSLEFPRPVSLAD